ncbi:MAG: hypothetical protein COW11_02770 [Candidatus Omnitrophica bacterium CG12_big_fil_rev_8_21_14_0_65_43_15]|uniref:DOD-type homing endonuclease domain-containing protein n=1 Tax=Candidatus Taenaricola geysiri TaxID=1974752 RepID=A0A2J0LP59_9BACT|nr:MAG: hypothetical protein AUJ89_04890 [Candidatus Omnitrophica bacterium CG1_02_43_210]PIW66546.1 MAG: hypothetical protein COW11_02770 [Candidatus Omnitrophica bacterium CG12_big_fil_rev_8_21_14_0_65_43_15]PIW80194.1 MAG: hypothetical protein COZ98_03545 [Candidatus Omnitrophica bacterium CG_4_8_14_3_um_filter_43_15]
MYKVMAIKKDKRIQRAKGGINVDFFKRWSPNMAYVLGYFAADGGVFTNSGGSRYIHFVSTDYELLEKVKRLLFSKHKIASKKTYGQNRKAAFLLQIGCKEIYEDLIGMGFTPNKSSRLKLPEMPKRYLRHFIRGYFDGDGSIMHGYYRRKNRNNKLNPYTLTCFACANRDFLRDISKTLSGRLGVSVGYVDKRGTHLYYAKRDSAKLFHYMYKGVSSRLYLERKFNKFQKAIIPGA